ncbi:MAG TPA: SRPBCC domain-containing protein [Candidatus Saccharimonadales bacterium]|nr:SRPBCC domain-containing protein [Candidatus Saccharimonadales bacterium]
METIRQTVVFDCPAHAFYAAFLDSSEHAEVTGAAAAIYPHVGGRYSAYNNELIGRFTQLVEDRLIMMQWRAAMPGWPEDHYATVVLELQQSSDGTTVEFEISDVPSELVAAIELGWQQLFWEPLAAYFAW